MMDRFLVYNPEEFRNYLMESVLNSWKKKEDKKQLAEDLLKHYKHGFYCPKLFLRIALGVFTFILGSSAVGVLALFFNGVDPDESGYAFFSFFCAGLFLFILEQYLRMKKMYRGGIDDMLLYMVYMAFATGLSILLFDNHVDGTTGLVIFLSLSTVLTLAGAVRYVDMLSAVLSLGSLFGVIAVIMENNHLTFFLPFYGALSGALLYFLMRKFRQRSDLFYWDAIFWILEIVSLLLLYVSLNYFVVRTLTEEMLGLYLEEGQDIPLAWFFYITTAIIPLLYLFLGIRQKNKILFRSGLLIFALSVVTFKIYFSTGHHEITLTVAGIGMLLFCFWLHRWLQQDKLGLTMKEDLDEDSYFDSESLLIANNFRIPNQGTIHTDPDKFGGGKFGGGGASDSF